MPVFAAYTLVFVKDMSRAVAFYQGALGMEVRAASPTWSELEIAGATVALHVGREGGEREVPLGFKVLNIDQVANAVVTAGGYIHSPKRQASGEPAIMKAGDTEGNIFFLSEGPGA